MGQAAWEPGQPGQAGVSQVEWRRVPIGRNAR